MAVSRVKTSSVLQGFPKYRSMLGGNAAYDPAATWLIQRQTLTSDTGSVTFSSIPTTYTSLQIRCITRDNGSGTSGSSGLLVRLNGDTGSNYAWHYLYGNGSVTGAFGAATQTSMYMGVVMRNGLLADTFATNIIDIHDYNSTTRNKTLRCFSGYDRNGAGEVYLYSGFRNNTAAVTSITLLPDALSFKAGSTFALYGMVG